MTAGSVMKARSFMGESPLGQVKGSLAYGPYPTEFIGVVMDRQMLRGGQGTERR
jgi:hypothetical protein